MTNIAKEINKIGDILIELELIRARLFQQSKISISENIAISDLLTKTRRALISLAMKVNDQDD